MIDLSTTTRANGVSAAVRAQPPPVDAGVGEARRVQREDDVSGTCADATGAATELSSLPHVQARIDEQLGALRSVLDQIKEELRQCAADQRLIEQMHEQLRSLSEQFHEREVIKPLALGLIRLVDRCTEQERRAGETLRLAKAMGQSSAESAARYLRDSRRADRVDLENLLTALAVEKFTEAGSEFVPSTQSCVDRVALPSAHLKGTVARRHRPGYRRHGAVVRSELVSVYAVPSANIKKGEPS
jgi:molecular chaperone GrpE (heat shock protein)